MSDENKPVSPAVQILCQQVVQRFLNEQEQLAKIAFETDKMDPASGYRLDVFNSLYVKPTGPALVSDEPPKE